MKHPHCHRQYEHRVENARQAVFSSLGVVAWGRSSAPPVRSLAEPVFPGV
jgi:hypothetical protein